MNQHCYTLMNGLTGLVASASAFTVTWMEHVELGLRIGTAGVGLVIAIITLRNLLRKP